MKRFNVARLNPEGGRDSSFQVGIGVSGPVIDGVDQSYLFRVALGADGKIVVSGVFTQINGVDRNNIARLNSDGTVDTTFNPPSLARIGFPYAWVYAAAIDQDGKVLMGALQSDSRLLVSSRFSPMVRLNADGTVDADFQIPEFTRLFSPRWPMFIALQSDGRVVVAGDFTAVAGWPRPGLARLQGGNLPRFVSSSLQRTGTSQFQFQLTASPNQLVIVEAATRLNQPEWIPILTNNAGPDPLSLIDTQADSYSTRFYRVRVAQ